MGTQLLATKQRKFKCLKMEGAKQTNKQTKYKTKQEKV